MTDKTRSLDFGLFVLRAALGVVFIVHGAQKLFVFGLGGTTGFLESIGVPFAAVNAALLIGVELGGGVALVAGAATRIASALLAFAMAVAVVTVHLPNGFFISANGYEFTLVLTLASAALALTGAGAWSIDALVSARPPAASRASVGVAA